MRSNRTAASLLPLAALLLALPASAQAAGGGVGANLSNNAIDTSRVKQLGCRLNRSRACASSGATQRQPTTRPSRVGGGARPRS